MGRQDKQTFDQRDTKHRRHHQRHGFKNLPHFTRDVHDGHKGDHIGGYRKKNRNSNSFCSLGGGIQEPHALAPAIIDIFPHHYGIVHHNAQCHDKGKHTYHIDGEIGCGQKDKGA